MYSMCSYLYATLRLRLHSSFGTDKLNLALLQYHPSKMVAKI